MTTTIYGVTVEYNEGGEFEAFLAEEAFFAEEARIHKELWEYLRTPEARLDPNYSDIFKDVYGVRPFDE